MSEDSLKLLKESTSILTLLEQLSSAFSKTEDSEIAWEGYLINLKLAKLKIEQASSLLDSNSVKQSSKKLSPSIARRIRQAPRGEVKEVPVNYIDSLEEFDEDQMVFNR